MAEVPTSYLPDFFLALEPQGMRHFKTEVLEARDGERAAAQAVSCRRIPQVRSGHRHR
jgi:hypothetical protein